MSKKDKGCCGGNCNCNETSMREETIMVDPNPQKGEPVEDYFGVIHPMNNPSVDSGISVTSCGSTYYYPPCWYYPTYGRTPHVCPVCEGRGNVPPGFYDRPTMTTSPILETCKSCSGIGIVWG